MAPRVLDLLAAPDQAGLALLSDPGILRTDTTLWMSTNTARMRNSCVASRWQCEVQLVRLAQMAWHEDPLLQPLYLSGDANRRASWCEHHHCNVRHRACTHSENSIFGCRGRLLWLSTFSPKAFKNKSLYWHSVKIKNNKKTSNKPSVH